MVYYQDSDNSNARADNHINYYGYTLKMYFNYYN